MFHRRGNQRRVAVFKNKKKAEDNKELEGVTSLSFSKEAELILQDLFTRFPPEEGEEGQATVGGISGKIPIVHRLRDDMFSRPLMSKEQIAKKVESLASKIKNDAQLRQVLTT